MDELLRTSLLWRLFAALAALYHRTFLPRMFAAIHRAFAESLPGRTLRRLLGGQRAVERSAYRRLMDRGCAASGRASCQYWRTASFTGSTAASWARCAAASCSAGCLRAA